jgi:uncharacterized protein (DUF488 family)
LVSTLYTIGHSNHPIDRLVRILRSFEIGLVADVRSIPKSRYNPQFNQADLERELHTLMIEYWHLKDLGGLRHTTRTSINTGWKNASFRGFADYMQTEGFKDGIEQLLLRAPEKQIVLMCAEAVPWRCHRSLIADALLVRDVPVEHIMREKVSIPHKLTAWAKVDGNKITYPGTDQPAGETELVDDFLESHSAG